MAGSQARVCLLGLGAYPTPSYHRRHLNSATVKTAVAYHPKRFRYRTCAVKIKAGALRVIVLRAISAIPYDRVFWPQSGSLSCSPCIPPVKH